ncbi:unnamed protein product [Rotaria sordida]|nr:unnamed protein product [Rotaria sordida]
MYVDAISFVNNVKIDFGIRGIALHLLYKLLAKLTHEQLYKIAQILYVDGPNEWQIWTLEIYKCIYDYITNYLTKEIKTSIRSLSEMFYHHVGEQLLELLSSKNEYIRVNYRNFWCDSKHLSTSSHHRLMALVDQLYSIKTENEYLNYYTNFLLECTTHNLDYNHFIFENPLDKCSFQEFPLAYQQQQQLSNSTSSIILQTQEISNRQEFISTEMLDNNNNNNRNYNWLNS